MTQCFKSGPCTNCILAECSLLKDLVFHDFIAEGVQGSVVAATYKKKQVAVKIELLNAYPVTMTRRKKLTCDSFWAKIPLFARLIATILRITNTQQIYDPITTAQFNQELKTAQSLGDLKVGPVVFDGGICLKNLQTQVGTFDVGLIIMEQYDMTLWEFLKDELGSMVDQSTFRQRIPTWHKIVRDLRKMTKKDIGISHGDLHFSNILVKKSRQGLKVAVIDFGFSNANDPDVFYAEIERVIDEMKNVLMDHARRIKIPIKEQVSLTKW